LPEEFRKNSTLGNIGIYYLFGPDLSGWIGLRGGSRHEETQEITWEQMSWGIPPQSNVQFKMKLESVWAVIMKNGRLVIWVTGSELEIETSSKRCDWPDYSSPFYSTTAYEIRISSAHESPVKVGLRSDDEGVDFIVPAKGTASICVPSGKYDVYFQFADDPTSLYQGDSLDVGISGIEIQMKGKEAGDYKIRKIK
jgi:hypothetical protein